MRIQLRLCFAFFLGMIFASQLLHAQFQEPTKEELQMTSDPQAPGAAAVYPSLREFYRKIAAADQQQLVLIANAPSKGH